MSEPDPIITCPICSKNFKTSQIDEHLDYCLGEAEDIIPQMQPKPPSSSPSPNSNEEIPEKQSYETWSEYYARRGKIFKDNVQRVVVPKPAPVPVRSNAPFIPRPPPAPIVNNIVPNNVNNNDDFLEFSENIKCPYTKSCGEVHIDQFVQHVNDFHKNASNHNQICPICEMYSPGLYLQQNPNTTRLIDHLNQIHCYNPSTNDADEEDLWEEIPEEWLKEKQEEEEGTFSIPKLHFSDLQIAEYQLTEITASGLIGVECQICVEEFLSNQMVIRMECFCVFHSNCAKQWFSKQSGRNVCPVHRDDTPLKK